MSLATFRVQNYRKFLNNQRILDKNINDMTRHLQKELKFLMAAMIIIGAGSAFAQSENLTEGTDLGC